MQVDLTDMLIIFLIVVVASETHLCSGALLAQQIEAITFDFLYNLRRWPCAAW